MRPGARTLLLAALVATGAVTAQEPDVYTESDLAVTDEAGAGLVLELDHGDGATDADAGMQPRELSDSDVEMILGGAASDGMAKRTRLKKED